MHNPYKDFSKISPQREDGHRQIENSVFQALMRADLPGIEYSTVLCIIDKTWGFNKTEDIISLSQFADATTQDRGNCAKALQSLEKKHIILIQKSGPGRGKGNLYMFNKHWDTWKLPLRERKGVPATPFKEIVSSSQQLASNSVLTTLLRNSVEATSIREGNGVKSDINGVTHAQGNSVVATPTKESIKKLTKETILSLAEGFIKILPKLPGWFFDEEDDKKWVAEFLEDLPDTDLMLLKACAEYHSSKPASNKGVWKNRFRNWVRHEREWHKEQEKHSAKEKEKGVDHGEKGGGLRERGGYPPPRSPRPISLQPIISGPDDEETGTPH